MSLTWVLLFMTTIISSQATQCPNSDGRCSSFAASRYPNNYLGCESRVNTLQVNNVTACIRTCLRTPFCFSTNFKQSKCELLRSTRTTRPKHCLLQKEGWEHIEVAVSQLIIRPLDLTRSASILYGQTLDKKSQTRCRVKSHCHPSVY